MQQRTAGTGSLHAVKTRAGAWRWGGSLRGQAERHGIDARGWPVYTEPILVSAPGPHTALGPARQPHGAPTQTPGILLARTGP